MLLRRNAWNVVRQLTRAVVASPVDTSTTTFSSPPRDAMFPFFRNFAAMPTTPKRAEAALAEEFGSDHLGKTAASIAPTGKITQVQIPYLRPYKHTLR